MSRIWLRRVVFPLPRKPARSDTGGDSAAAALNSVTDEAPAARRRKLFDDQATRLWEEAAKETHRKNICRTIKRSGSSRMTHFDFNPILAVTLEPEGEYSGLGVGTCQILPTLSLYLGIPKKL